MLGKIPAISLADWWRHFRWAIWPRISYVVIEGCEYCGNPVAYTYPGMTAYPFDGVPGTPGDPNRPRRYCRTHGEQHTEYWKGMWDEYYSSQGY